MHFCYAYWYIFGLHLTLDKLSEANIGELILYYEILTSLTGSILNIDTYNQPGVELGKRILADKFKKD